MTDFPNALNVASARAVQDGTDGYVLIFEANTGGVSKLGMVVSRVAVRLSESLATNLFDDLGIATGAWSDDSE